MNVEHLTVNYLRQGVRGWRLAIRIYRSQNESGCRILLPKQIRTSGQPVNTVVVLTRAGNYALCWSSIDILGPSR